MIVGLIPMHSVDCKIIIILKYSKFFQLQEWTWNFLIINPRRMRSEGYSSRSVCPSVCLFVSIYSRTTGYEAAYIYERYQQLQCYKGRKNNVAILLKPLRSGDMAWKQAKKPICIMSTGLPRLRLARSAHCGRMKLLRGYVSKSSVLNRLTITQLAS